MIQELFFVDPEPETASLKPTSPKPTAQSLTILGGSWVAISGLIIRESYNSY